MAIQAAAESEIKWMPLGWLQMCWEVWATCKERNCEEKQASVVRVWKRKHVLAASDNEVGFIINQL